MIYPSIKSYWKIVVALCAVELLSWLAYTGSRSEMYVSIALLILTGLLAWKRPVWLAYASIAELIVGSKGYLFFLNIGHTELSIRMVIYIFLLIAASLTIIREWKSCRTTVMSNSFLLFIGWLITSVIIALVRQNDLSIIYTDVNAFLYLALLPAWWFILRRDVNWRTNIMAILLAGATVIGLKSWLMVLLFGHDFGDIRHVYEWIRNTGVGEITYINANIYRVFFQSQIYSVIGLSVSLNLFIRHHPPRWLILPMAFSALGVYISLSRSFWLGLGVAIIALVIWLISRKIWRPLLRLWILFPLVAFSWIMMVWALNFPSLFVIGGADSAARANAVMARLQNKGSSNAATARANQIQPLLTSIGRHPVIGSGFGTTVTYFSTDPRSKGLRTTTAFEIGYLDLWLKIGLVGMVLYAFWVFGIWRRIARTPWAGVFIISGISLVTVHLTSPYLNHPLGLGWLMLTSLYAYDHG